MKISIYQIVPELDEQNLIFRNLETILTACNQRIPAEIYECVFIGDLNDKTPEDIFVRFNTALPEGYKGRSMSISDIVEFEQTQESKFYFCDVTDFKAVAFEKEMAQNNG